MDNVSESAANGLLELSRFYPYLSVDNVSRSITDGLE